MRAYRQSKFNRRARGRRRYRERVSEDIPQDPTHRLLWACYYGDLGIAREAIRSGAKINGNKGAGVTPLINACKLGDQDLIKLIMDKGADPGLAVDNGMTPLHFVAQRNDAETAERLIRAGADPAPVNDAGLTPVAVANNFGNEEVAIAIQSMISLAHANRAKVVRFPAERRKKSQASARRKPAPNPLAGTGLKI